EVGDQQGLGEMRGKPVESTKGLRAASTRLEPLLVMTLLGSAWQRRLGRLEVAETLLGQQDPVASGPLDRREGSLRPDHDGTIVGQLASADQVRRGLLSAIVPGQSDWALFAARRQLHPYHRQA